MSVDWASNTQKKGKRIQKGGKAPSLSQQTHARDRGVLKPQPATHTRGERGRDRKARAAERQAVAEVDDDAPARQASAEPP